MPPSEIPRKRYSIQELEDSHPDKLDKVMRAFIGIQGLSPHDPKSFFRIAAYHGQPFRGPGVTEPTWWGGYCNHGNVLFPTWHRTLTFQVEEALRSIPGCEDVTLPYWDELDKFIPKKGVLVPLPGPKWPVPRVLTSEKYTFHDTGETVDNPLYSYTLQEALVYNVKNQNRRYSKPVGYKTKRYPQAGLVGTPDDENTTDQHNKVYADVLKNTDYLNNNVTAWMEGEVDIPDDGSGARIPDTFSVLSRYKLCLDAPNYTVFSNTTSARQWMEDFSCRKTFPLVYPLESPHNAIHLAVGGFYQKAAYNADPILGANGDMGANEVAGFDPIFYLHHCFVDYVFWTWQVLHEKTKKGSLKVFPHYPGTIVPDDEGIPHLPPGTALNMKTPLYPFRHENQKYVTSDDVTDIREMGYEYSPGSLDRLHRNKLFRPGMPDIEEKLVAFQRVSNIDRSSYPGSFVIRTSARREPTIANPDPKWHEIGREPILSRMNVGGCANCQNKLEVDSWVPIFEGEIEAIVGKDKGAVEFGVNIQTWDGTYTKLLNQNDGPKITTYVAAGRDGAATEAGGDDEPQMPWWAEGKE